MQFSSDVSATSAVKLAILHFSIWKRSDFSAIAMFWDAQARNKFSFLWITLSFKTLWFLRQAFMRIRFGFQNSKERISVCNPGRGQNCSHCNSRTFTPLLREILISLSKDSLLPPRVRGEIGRLWGQGSNWGSWLQPFNWAKMAALDFNCGAKGGFGRSGSIFSSFDNLKETIC